MPESLCLAGICMSTSNWVLLGIGVTLLAVGAVVSLSRGLTFVGSSFQSLGSFVSNFFKGVGLLLICGVCLFLIYYLLTHTLPEGAGNW